MRILDRYILKSVLGMFFGCLFMFLLLYCVIDVFSNLEDILKQKVSLNILADYYLSYIPIIFTQVTPTACLLSTLYTFARLNRDNEIIAMRSSGLSILNISQSVIIFGIIVSVFVFWVNDRFVPSSLVKNQRVKEQMEEGAKKTKEKKEEIITNLSMYGLRNRLFFVSKFSVATDTMEGITILEHDEHQNITKKIVANKGIYKDNLWEFYQSITYDFDQNGQVIQEPRYSEEEIMTIPESPHDFVAQRQRPDFMTIAQLEDYIWKLSRSGATTVIRNLKIDLYQRFVSPFTSLIMILIGIPFSLMIKKRAAALSSFGLCIMVGFLYYVLNAVAIAFGKGGVLPPVLSASLSHVVAFVFSLRLIYTLP
ncbi:MAG: LptF/LptG family permease [Candidatus Omnitrophica bacterium]|nr:LptF/LptG family permease [Candidatus Omnitrophota bacterium]